MQNYEYVKLFHYSKSQKEELKFISKDMYISFRNFKVLCQYLQLENKTLDLSCISKNHSGGQINNIILPSCLENIKHATQFNNFLRINRI